MEKIDKAIEILQAFKAGKEIELWDGKKWISIDEYEAICRDLYHYHDTLRVKPQPTYRPYANAEEFIKGAEKQRKIDIDKACKWLEEHAIEYNGNTGFDEPTIDIEEFRKAMRDEHET